MAAESERGLVMRVLLHSPKDTIAGAAAFAVACAIVTNALFLQAGPHPAPMFGSFVPVPAVTNLLPRPRPAEADLAASEPRPADPRAGEKVAEPRIVELRSEPRTPEPKSSDSLANLVRSTTAPAPSPSSVMRPPAPIPLQMTGARKVAAVQRALTEYGYGQLKPTGTIGTDTQAAIQKFERERRMPVTGQVSDRLVRELTAVIGHPID